MPDLPILTLDMQLQRRTLSVEARFSLEAPWTCLFGPSGSGKSSILRAIAGSENPNGGRIVLGGAREWQVLFDAAAHIFVPPHRRAVRSAAQQSWLFPGTVAQNLLFGVPAERHKACLEAICDRLALGALARSRVEALSGGERQRVSVARTVAAAVFGAGPTRLVLLDEPFTGMDTTLRDRLAVALRLWLAECRIPVLSVTHDVGEVFLLGAEVIRIADGKAVAQGPAADVLAAERRHLLGLLG